VYCPVVVGEVKANRLSFVLKAVLFHQCFQSLG
jgi:hypothetical protein